MRLVVEFEREDDGRWLADIPTLRGVMVYGDTREQALENVKVLALRVIADKLEHHELVLDDEVSFAARVVGSALLSPPI